ncbi:MAG: YfiR family protein [Candidatus Acidiferrales bacterium]
MELTVTRKVLSQVIPQDSARAGAFRRWTTQNLARLVCLGMLMTGLRTSANSLVYAQQAPTEFQVKAAYLFNFLKFVEWPEDVPADLQSHWVIGIVGNQQLDDELTQLVSGKIVQGHVIQIKALKPAEDLRACHILFIGTSEKKQLPPILANLRGSSVLTVADMDNFVESGGMIQLVMEDNRVRLAIDVGATVRAHLKVSSKLLALARVVTGAERGANN